MVEWIQKHYHWHPSGYKNQQSPTSLYRVSQTKRNGGFSVTCEMKKKKKKKIWLSNLESMPTSWNTVIFKVRLSFADERRIVSGQGFHKVFSGSPLIHGNKRNTDQWASTKHRMEGFSLHNSSLVGRRNQAKFENDCISWNGHRIKITQPNLMILV